MNRFRLNFILYIAGTVLFTAFATLCFAGDRYALGIMSLIPAVISVILLWLLVRRLIRAMSDFMDALDMNDTTIRFAESHDPDINRMSNTMRRIMAVYSSSRMELETRKLYYDRILRIMTHEMRNAITPIVSLSADMKRNPDRYKGENLNEAVSLISDESQSIRRFLDSYYELTHLPKPQIETIDVMEFFTGIRKAFAIYLTDNGLDPDIMDYTIPVDMRLRADRDLLGRNAVQAVAGVSEPHIHVDVSVSEGRPYISIEDNGCGIPAEMMQNLFQPFFTTKPGGSGIGLCLSRQIARLHGGDFTISSTPGHGTKAIITL